MSDMVREVARVNALPERLPWIEGIDYLVIGGDLQFGDPIRIRDNTGETFLIYSDPGVILPPPPKHWNALEFKLLFTSTERNAIRASQAAGVADFWDLLSDAASSGDAVSEVTQWLLNGMTALVGASIITSDRQSVIMGS